MGGDSQKMMMDLKTWYEQRSLRRKNELITCGVEDDEMQRKELKGQGCDTFIPISHTRARQRRDSPPVARFLMR